MRKPRRSRDFLEYEKVLSFKEKELILEELNTTQGDVKVALIFPKNYELASSSLAFSYVQRLLSSHPRIRCERFFFDETFSKFYSLESQTPLDEFRIWAFSVSVEEDFFNVLEILKRRGVPLFQNERESYHPIVVVGGALTYTNASVFLPIADAIYHGELEEFLEDFQEALLEEERNALLEKMSRIPAVSCPSFGKSFEKFGWVKDLSVHKPYSHFVSGFGVFSGKLLVEIGRGCIRRCNFCVFGRRFKPARFLRLEILKEVYEKVAYREWGLISATITDYPWLEELIEFLEEENLRISVSSMRLDGLKPELLKVLKKSGQQSFTIAPEAGTQRIRDVLGKDITDEQIEKALKMGRESGFERVKMYFIYGIEEETEEDLAGVKEIVEIAKRMGYVEVHLSLNPLIPKPGTGFENREMLPFEELKRRESFLREILRMKGVRVDFESLRDSVIQYTISRCNEEQARKWVRIFDKEGKEGLRKRVFEEGRKVSC